MMEAGVLSRKSPLYGRKSGHIKVRKLPFSSYFEFYPNNTAEENVEYYSITGGVPFYMEKFSEDRSVFENVKEEIASRKGRLFEEIEFLLKEEFREPDTYKKIIEAISFGNNKLVQIAN
ncbi:MAG: ATP-binding protein, partial [Candidatus Iainarchaeum archaeon]